MNEMDVISLRLGKEEQRHIENLSKEEKRTNQQLRGNYLITAGRFTGSSVIGQVKHP